LKTVVYDCVDIFSFISDEQAAEVLKDKKHISTRNWYEGIQNSVYVRFTS